MEQCIFFTVNGIYLDIINQLQKGIILSNFWNMTSINEKGHTFQSIQCAKGIFVTEVSNLFGRVKFSKMLQALYTDNALCVPPTSPQPSPPPTWTKHKWRMCISGGKVGLVW